MFVSLTLTLHLCVGLMKVDVIFFQNGSGTVYGPDGELLITASVVAWSKNPIANNKIKHLGIGIKYIPEMVQHGIVNILNIASKENASDIMIK